MNILLRTASLRSANLANANRDIARDLLLGASFLGRKYASVHECYNPCFRIHPPSAIISKKGVIPVDADQLQYYYTCCITFTLLSAKFQHRHEAVGDARCRAGMRLWNLKSTWTFLNELFSIIANLLAANDVNVRLTVVLFLPQGQILKVAKDKSIENSNFNPKRKTKFIIHGFIDTPLSNWVKEMRSELLVHGDYNVIVVDWAGGSLPLYTQATANTRLVGLELAHLIKHLQTNYGLDPNDVHLIGHSLGAHTAGYAGDKLGGNIGRITGLDPAEPYFQGMPSHLRLDYTDARLVDVIHTDGKSIFFLGYGMSQPCGHLDFYPNNGKEQPGCTDLSETTPSLPLTLIREGLEEASRVLVACNHVRALKLFIESINSKCQYVAHECSSYASFQRGECFSCKSNNSLSCAVMGYHADTSPALVKRQAMGQDVSSLLGSKFFFMTGKEDPYCRRHYRITINLARPPTAESWVQGFMKVTLHADKGVIRNMDLTPSGYMKLEHGSTARMVVAHPTGSIGNIGKIRRVELSWVYDMDVLQPRSLCFFWCNDHLYVNSVKVDAMDLPGRGKREADFSSRLCSASRQEYAEIASGSTATFVDNC
ncbi:pancreatic triacylglycerol lipase isoform X2 [Solenopsis invicta]|uniref:pancreatic triacylglycerol lipase isoform X2 n=1 Tax=Solenopsis invicta TaxID=13686 RepID=UPI00193E595A|nr:pancreatic triacylglycerol lipase isoform X2 [Solenopsis invicta]